MGVPRAGVGVPRAASPDTLTGGHTGAQKNPDQMMMMKLRFEGPEKVVR